MKLDTAAAIPRAGMEDLLVGKFHEYLHKAVSPGILALNNHADEQRLQSMGFMTPDGEVNHTGLLCFGKEPQKWLGGAYIQFLLCPGTNMESAADAVECQQIGGTIFQQIRDMESLMKAQIKPSAITGGEQQLGTQSYPFVALQQAIRNAILHRSYEDTNTPIQCHWFADRVEISNPGGPYGCVTTDNFGEGSLTDYRNRKLAEVMDKADLIERFGFGLGAIRRSMKRNGNPAPEFHATKTTVKVTLKARPTR